MKRHIQPIVFFVVLLGVSSLQAATITYQTRDINAGVQQSDYKASWGTQTSAVTTLGVSDFNWKWGGNNTFSHLTVDFKSGASQVSFQLAVDAGYGGALYLDNNLVAIETKDLWWGYDWNNSSQLLFSYANTLQSGNHVLEAFWAEGCCNGANAGRFALGNGSGWQSLSVDNLNGIVPTPIPGAVWLFGSGVAGLMATRRKKMLVAPLAA